MQRQKKNTFLLVVLAALAVYVYWTTDILMILNRFFSMFS